MSNITLEVKYLAPRWEFVNMFYNRRSVTYFCRLRYVDIGKPQNDWPELIGSGATMQIAFDNANESAKQWRPQASVS